MGFSIVCVKWNIMNNQIRREVTIEIQTSFCCMYICLMSYRISLMLRFQYEQIFSSIVLSSIIAKLMFLLFCYGTRIHLSHHYLSQSNVYSTEFVPFNLHWLLNITSYIKLCADFNEHTLFSRIFIGIYVLFCILLSIFNHI